LKLLSVRFRSHYDVGPRYGNRLSEYFDFRTSETKLLVTFLVPESSSLAKIVQISVSICKH
jgi:hypothetical protein